MKMYGYGDFHESYYEHACSIVYEKDILEIDIEGASWVTYLRRWWYNLFLLSYTDKRARLYYNSSHAMKVERARHFRRRRFCIHPLSKFRNFWDFLILIIVLTNKIIFYHTASLSTGQLPVPFVIMGVVFEFLMFLDIYINTRCGYVHKTNRKIVLDVHKSLHRYCTTKIFFHAASSIPILTLMFLRYGLDINCIACKSNKFICCLRVLDVIRLFRIYELSSYWTRERGTFTATSFFRILRICVLGFMTIEQYVAMLDNFNLFIFITSGYINHNTYYGLIMSYKFRKEKPPSNLQFIAYDVARIVKSLLLFNFGFSVNSFYYDRVSCLILYALANCFYILGLLEVISCVTRKMYSEEQIMNYKVVAKNMARCRQLPDKVSLKLNQYYDFNMSTCRSIEKQSDLYKCLPVVLKRDIIMYSYSRKVLRIPYFSEWPIKVIEGLMSLLKEELYLNRDVVAESGVQGSGLVIVDVGVMSVYTQSHFEVGHLIDGDYFGELSLVTDKEIRSSYVLAITNCKVLVLEKTDFRMFMRNYPTLFFKMKQKLRLIYNSRDIELPSPIEEYP